jgi:hypothetical protein
MVPTLFHPFWLVLPLATRLAACLPLGRARRTVAVGNVGEAGRVIEVELRFVACEQRSVVFITSIGDDFETTLQDDTSKRARLSIFRIQHCELRRLIVRADWRDERGV